MYVFRCVGENMKEKVVRFPKSYLTKSSGFYNITKRNLNFQPQKYAMQIRKKIDLIQTIVF